MHALTRRRDYFSRRRILVLFLVASAAVMVPGIHKVSAAGLLYVNPPKIAVMPIGSSFTVQVKVSGMDSFSGWDISVVSDPTVINATSLSVDNNILSQNATGGIFLEAAHCVNTNAAPGCSQSDGPGVVESAAGDSKSVAGPASGLLFNITYKVVGTYPYSLVSFSNTPDLVSNAGQTVIHTDGPGSYGSQVAPDFSVASQYPKITVFPGHSNTSQITVTSSLRFTGIVNLTAISPSNNITIVLFPKRVMVPSDGHAISTLNITASRGTAPSTYPSFKLFGRSGNLTRSTDITITVEPEPDFVLGANPGELLTSAQSSNSTTVIVKSENGFSGTVTLVVDHPPGAKSSLSTSSLMVPRDGLATATLNITTQSSNVRFVDKFNVTVTFTGASPSQSLTHILQVVAEPPPPDFGISIAQISVSVLPGESKLIAINFVSLDYFAGTIYLFGTSKSGIGFSFNPSSFHLEINQTLPTTLTVVTDSSTQPGDRIITITGSTTTSLPGLTPFTINHSINITLGVTSVPQTAPLRILGLPPAAYFGIIVALAVLVAVVGLRVVRKPSTKKRTIFEN